MDANVRAVLSVEVMMKQTIYGYYGDKPRPFLKITLALPKYVPKAKGILESGAFSFRGFPSIAQHPFESNLAYEMRFMIDCKVKR